MQRLATWWAPSLLLVVIVMLQAIFFVTIMITAHALNSESAAEQVPSGALAYYSVAKNAVVFFVILAVVRWGGASASRTLRLIRVSGRCTTMSCFMILSLVPWVRYLAGHLVPGRMAYETDLSHFNIAMMVSGLSLVLLAPVVEELFFRGFTLSVMGKKSAIAGVLGSCALYAIYHFDGSIGSLIVHLPFALATAYSVVVTGSVYPAIVAHSLWNLLAMASDAGYVFLEPTRGILLGSLVVGAACAALLPRGISEGKKRCQDDFSDYQAGSVSR